MRRLLLPLLLCSLASPVWAETEGDRSEIEAKKKEREEREKRRAEAAQKFEETSEQREERERKEKRDANVKEARKRAEAAVQAASKRQNSKGLELMMSAWRLDPTNLEYASYTAEFAKAVNNNEVEFEALAAASVTAKRALAQQAENSPKRGELNTKLAELEARMGQLRTTLSTGVLRLKVEPKECEIYMEGAFVGKGEGEIEAIAGQRKVTTSCMGYQDWEQFVNARVGDPTSVTIKPKQISYFGKLIVKVDPSDGVTVYLDDVPVGDRAADKPTAEGKIAGSGTRQDPYQLAARKWIIRFAKDGYDRWHRRIEIKRDQLSAVEAKLEMLSEINDTSQPTKPAAKPPAKAGK